MTTIRTIATHEVVRALHPRPVTERDQIGMAAGKAIDSALAQFSHEFRERRRPSLATVDRIASQTFDEELESSMLRLTADDRQRQLREISGVLRAFRTSELMGLSRPRSRLILIDESAGVYAQPDYWNGRDRFYEMKSYHADPIPPDVTLQLQLFQLAFPDFRAFLAEFDRHAPMPRAVLREFGGLPTEERHHVLLGARSVAMSIGLEKVLEYVDNPVVRYTTSDP